jgi:uncharacterized membrane protein/thiol-disulfide isomerase/thioredoxin
MKREKLYRFSVLILVLALISVQNMRMVFAEPPIVHAVLFYSPTCPHCHKVITEVLPPLFDRYGDQLQIVGVDVTTPGGQTLYQSAIEHFTIPTERLGVPTLILDKTVLVGELEIPAQLPALIEQYLARGGVDLPDVPGLAAAIRADEQQAQPTATIGSAAGQSKLILSDDPASPDILNMLSRDPIGHGLSILLLVGMLAAVIRALVRMKQAWSVQTKTRMLISEVREWRWDAVAVLCLVGLVVSLYMTYVETTHTPAVCGPIGDCNTVQQSVYAALFGIIPIGVLGVVGYLALLITCIGARWGRGRLRSLSEEALLGMALSGTLFSIYLTFLEPFVIGAVCVWCLTSALSMMLILVILVGLMPVSSELTRRIA